MVKANDKLMNLKNMMRSGTMRIENFEHQKRKNKRFVYLNLIYI